jgi:hypothetical protein
MGKDVNLLPTNLGEFQGEVKISRDFELRLPNPKGAEIIVPRPCLLAGLTGSAEEPIEEGRD